MAGFTDAMAIDGKAVIRKIRNGKSLRKGGAVNLEQCDIKITSTVESELSNVQSKKTKAIEALSKMHIEHQKLDGGNKGNDVVRMWAEKVLQNRRDSDG